MNDTNKKEEAIGKALDTIEPLTKEEIKQEEDFRNAFNMEPMLATAGKIQITKEQEQILYAPIDETRVQIRPDGIVYMPWVEYAKRLRETFGLQFAFIPQGMPKFIGNYIYWGFWLVIMGNFVGFAMGEQQYQPTNKRMTYGDAVEGAKSNARMRACKDIGLFPEMWEPDWVAAWIEKHAERYRTTGGDLAWRKIGSTGNGNEAEEEKSPYLESGSKLHKAFEAMIAEQELDRALVHEFLFATNRLDGDDSSDLSFKGVKESTVKMALDNPKKFKQEFAKWASLIKGD